MTKYFENVKTIEDVKQLYKKYARELHPDCNPLKDTTAEFQNMNNQYQEAFNKYKNIRVNAEGETYEKETDETPEEFADMINRLLKIKGIVIELCGSWWWVSGNTRDAREELKEMKFRFSSKKQAWYFHYEPYRKRSKSEKTLDDIRNMYGSQRFATRTDEQKQITA